MFFKRIIEYKGGYHADQTIEEIGGSIQFKAFNLSILICAAFLASIGLDTNSAAVIIGAMLISPLMSPILGVGLAIGINDKEMLMLSLKNLLFAMSIALVVSYFYFLITPLGVVTSEIMARTQPTLLDVLVAFFGGIAGIVAGSQKEKTPAIPGVAIATALMPPLCTAGYGIATQTWTIFFGAFYLFILNAVFISLSTFLIVRYLDFPVKHYVDKKKDNQVKRGMAFFLVLIVSPSIFFLFQVYKSVKIKGQIEATIIKRIEQFSESRVLSWEIDKKDTLNVIKVYEAGDEIPDSTVNSLNSLLHQQGFDNYKLKIIRVNISKDEVAEMSKKITREYLNNVILDNKLANSEPIVVKDTTVDYNQVYKELKALNPHIVNFKIAPVTAYYGSDTVKTLKYQLVSLTMKNKTTRKLKKELQEQMRHYFQFKIKSDSIQVEIL